MKLEAVKLEANRRFSSQDIAASLQQQFNIQRAALIGAMDCLYWFAKEEVAHTTKYVPLMDLLKRRGATYVDNLHVAGIYY